MLCALACAKHSDARPDILRAFAADLAGADAALLRRVEAILADPPSTTEEIGYYGFNTASAEERAARALLTALVLSGKILAVEDKYIYELASVLEDRGLAAPLAKGAAFDAWYETLDDAEAITDADWQALRLWFPQHVQAIDAGVTARGRRLMFIEMPPGDTLHLVALPPALAAKWQGVALFDGLSALALSTGRPGTIRVIAPNWGLYWDFLTYALRMPEHHWRRPDGL